MKKIIKYTLIILLIVITIVLLSRQFKAHHTIKYNLNDKKVKVLETYHKDKTSDYYLFEVDANDKKFIFDIDNKFKKKKRVLKEIILYNNENITCLYPIFIKDIDYKDIQCNIDNKLYAYDSIKEKYALKEFITQIPNYDKNDYINKADNVLNYDRLKIFSDNLYDNEDILIYNYKNLIKVNNNKVTKIDFSDFDVYNNNLGILIDNLYLIPEYTNKPEISSYYMIDIIKEKKSKISLENILSTNIYINGVVDKKLYLFDKSNVRQYQIDPYKKKTTLLGDKNKVKFYDGKWLDFNPYELINEEKKFNVVNIDEDLPFKYKQIFENYNSYYYYNDKNEFYRVYKSNLNHPIFLFKIDNFKEVSLVNNKIYFIIDTKLYRYDSRGIKTILDNSELKYNYKNIYSAYFE